MAKFVSADCLCPDIFIIVKRYIKCSRDFCLNGRRKIFPGEFCVAKHADEHVQKLFTQNGNLGGAKMTQLKMIQMTLRS